MSIALRLVFIFVTFFLSTLIPCVLDCFLDKKNEQPANIILANIAINFSCVVAYDLVKWNLNVVVFDATTRILDGMMFPGTILASITITALWKFFIKNLIPPKIVFKFLYERKQLRQTWENIRYIFADYKTDIPIQNGEFKSTYPFAVCGVNEETFMNFVYSGKAKLYNARHGFLQDIVVFPNSDIDISFKNLFQNTQFLVGVCKVQETGLIFYPKDRKTMQRVYHSMCLKTEHDQNTLYLQKQLESLQNTQRSQNERNLQTQNNIAENQKRMNDFLTAFQEENLPVNEDKTDDENELFFMDPEDLKPKLRL